MHPGAGGRFDQGQSKSELHLPRIRALLGAPKKTLLSLTGIKFFTAARAALVKEQ
jgi:hypothetical protein